MILKPWPAAGHLATALNKIENRIILHDMLDKEDTLLFGPQTKQ